MKYFCLGLAFFALMGGITGCRTAPPKPEPNGAQTISALKSVSQGLANQPVSEAQLKNLSVQAEHDPQTSSALRSINTALSPVHTVKYCPVDGERFSADMIYCPVHHVKLKWVE